MWKMIFGQSILQLTVTFVFHFAGTKLFPSWHGGSLKTVVFNAFVFLQIFNEINCRRLDDKINVFSGIQRNPFFIVIMMIMVTCQVIIIFVGGAAFSVTRLNGQQWLISMSLGLLTLPAGAIVRCTPNAFINRFLPRCILRPKTYYDSEGRQIENWDDAIGAIHDDLLFFKRLRGERSGGVGRNQSAPVVERVSANVSPSETASLDYKAQNTSSPSPQPPSRLYSVNSASTLVPGLVALSMALPPATQFSAASAAGTGVESVNSRDSVPTPAGGPPALSSSPGPTAHI
jgi:Ca2+-transporting ATPase